MCNGIICRHFIMPISKPAIEGVSFIEAENIPPELDSVNTDERKLLAFYFSFAIPFKNCPIINGITLIKRTVSHPAVSGAVTSRTSLTIGT